jgi:hypothetical protein
MAVSALQGKGSFGLLTFLSDTDLPAGVHTFTLDGAGATPWRVSFSLPVVATPVLPATSLDANGFRLGLDDVTINASVVRVGLNVALLPGAEATRAWYPIARLVHGSTTIPIHGGTAPDMGIGRHVLFSESGVSDPSGAWKLVITEMVGIAGDGSQVRVPMDTTLEFWVP